MMYEGGYQPAAVLSAGAAVLSAGATSALSSLYCLSRTAVERGSGARALASSAGALSELLVPFSELLVPF